MVMVGAPEATSLCLNKNPSRSSCREIDPRRKMAPKNKTVHGGLRDVSAEWNLFFMPLAKPEKRRGSNKDEFRLRFEEY